MVETAFLHKDSNPAETARLANEITTLSQQYDYHLGIAQAHNLRGLAAMNQAQYSEALRSFLIAYREFEELDDQKSLSSVLNNMNLVYQSTGNYAQALNLCFQALAIAEMLEDSVQQARTLHNIALLYDRERDYPAALETFERALVIKKKIGNSNSLALTFGAMGDLYSNIGDDEKAMHYVRASLRLTRTTGNIQALAMGLESIGRIYIKHRRWSLAMRYLHAALKIQKNRLSCGRLYILLSDVYRSVERHEEALCSAQKGLSIGIEFDHPEAMRDAHQSISLTAEAEGNFPLALEHLKQAMVAVTAFQEREKQRHFIELRVRQETEDARRDAENERQKNALLQQLVLTDHLTGLLNRRAMQERISEAMLRMQNEAIPFTLCIADIDHFKSVNDQYGHDVGDAVLIDMAQRLQMAVGETGVVARWGGEEFCLLFDDAGAHEIAQRLQNFLSALRAEPTKVNDLSLSISLTIGVTDYCPDDSENDLLRRADAALYTGKRAGRDCVMVAPIS